MKPSTQTANQRLDILDRPIDQSIAQSIKLGSMQACNKSSVSETASFPHLKKLLRENEPEYFRYIPTIHP